MLAGGECAYEREPRKASWPLSMEGFGCRSSASRIRGECRLATSSRARAKEGELAVMHGCIWRVLSVANLLHKPAGISATSGCPWGCKGLWTSKASCPVWFGESCVATCFRARARDGELAFVHGCTCSTTLRRWHSGYHSFQLRVSKLVLAELPATDVTHCLPQAYAQAIL